MTFLELLEENHKDDIDNIKDMIDVEAWDGAEYREAAALCKFLYDSDDRYGLLAEPAVFNSFYCNAHDFSMLCDNIFHALTDDGEITLFQINDMTPQMVFRRHVKADDFVPLSRRAADERIAAFKKEKGLGDGTLEYKIKTFKNAYEYIEAVKQNRKDYEIQVKRFEEWKRLNKRLENREKPNLEEVEFGTPHLKEE